MTQQADILTHLKTKGHITPIEALAEYGCFRLGARVWDLRQEGHQIITDRFTTDSGSHPARYIYAGCV